MRYTEGFKRGIVRKLLVPGAPSANAVAQETGISVQTIYNWLRTLKDSVQMVDHEKTPEEWTNTTGKKYSALGQLHTRQQWSGR